MTKVAIFVEGLTETELTIKILEALCGNRGVNIEIQLQHKGKLHFVEMRSNSLSSTYALVANCSCDGQVKTQIRDRYHNLINSGYSRIIGLWDIYPEKRSNISRMEHLKMYGMPTAPIPLELHLAIMEVESWFLDETSHFERIDSSLSIAKIAESGFDVVNINGCDWDHPAETLNAIYKIAGKSYKKSGRHIQRTVNSLSMENFYMHSTLRSPSLSAYITCLEDALFPAQAQP